VLGAHGAPYIYRVSTVERIIAVRRPRLRVQVQAGRILVDVDNLRIDGICIECIEVQKTQGPGTDILIPVVF
jgi:hypothetical protein